MGNKYKLERGTRVILTGASSGIGKVLAQELAKKFQARLILNSRHEKSLQQTAQLVREAGGQCEVAAGDISDKETAPKLAKLCLEKFGGIDLLVNNAGLARVGPVTSLAPEDWEFVFNINFFGALYACYAVLPHMLAARQGKIVNVASVAGKIALPGNVSYAASKFAMVGMSQGLAAELMPKNIDVITVCPGLVRTEFFDNNNMYKSTDPTAIAQQRNLRGWLMRNVLSIGPEQVSEAIIDACQQGGSQEIILTIPGIIIERIVGLCPKFALYLASRVKPRRQVKPAE